jgi:EmrB/QacA subfamily drug resistance transporter
MPPSWLAYGVTSDTKATYGSTAGRWIILATVLGSGMAFLDGTIVNVALPAIREELGGGLAGQQWVADSYLLTLGAMILLGGSLGDLYGRRKIFLIGVAGFAITSLVCGIAPSIGTLIVARALQGVSAALLTPGSLAIIQASFVSKDRSKAIGAWSGLSGVSTALGPFLGGYLVDNISWRWAFLINLPLAAGVLWVSVKHVPESKDPEAARTPDVTGAVTAAVALGGILYALIEGPAKGWSDPSIVFGAVIGTLSLVAFVLVQAKSSHPMVPLGIFRSRQFSGANITTLLVYGALGGAFLLVVLELQQVMGYSALEAGTALLPITILLLVASPHAGALAQRIGPRLPMTLGPLIAGLGLLLYARVGPGETYWSTVFPATFVFGVGLALTVAPLTAAVLAAVKVRHAGIASGINNAVARIAGLLAIALLPLASGMNGTSGDPQAFTDAFRRAVILAGVLCILGAINSLLTIRRLAPVDDEDEDQEPALSPGGAA